MNEKIEQLRQMVSESNRIVFFGGAGVSTESGIPDFRSADGLYSSKQYLSPEEILSHGFFVSHTEEFYKFYRGNMLFPRAKPNAAHYKLAELEAAGKLSAVVTQNIDGLHQAAGSKNVFELHGTVHKNSCTSCGKKFGLDFILSSTGIPRCECGGVIKPDVVLYGEQLNDETVSGAVEAIESADMLIVAGTSLVVYPAAGMVRYFHGKNSVLINLSATDYDSAVSLAINSKVGETLARI